MSCTCQRRPGDWLDGEYRLDVAGRRSPRKDTGFSPLLGQDPGMGRPGPAQPAARMPRAGWVPSVRKATSAVIRPPQNARTRSKSAITSIRRPIIAGSTE